MEETIEQRIGRRVRSLREEQNLTKTDFCLMVNLSRPYLNKIEKGVANPTIKVLEQIAKGFDIPVTYLIRPASEE